MGYPHVYFLLIFFVLTRCSTGQSSLHPIDDNCARWHHQSTIKDGYLYIDGGVEIFNYNGSKILGYNQYLLQIGMSTSWDWQKSQISSTVLDKTEDSQTGSKPQSLTRGALFHGASNDSKIYTYGGTTFLGNKSFSGWTPPESEAYSLWSFDPSSLSWEKYDITRGNPRRPNRGTYAEASNLGLAFYLNGQIDAGTSSATSSMDRNLTEYLSGMIIINTVDQSAVNVSTSTLGNPRVAGGLEYIEGIGQNGVLVALGGVQRTQMSGGQQTKDELVSFDHVHLCDDFIGNLNSTWYRQPTSGEVPPPRSDFCTVTAYAQDNSSYNIYLYGGIDTTNGTTAYDDVYTLSIPSFTWTSIYHASDYRWGHTCHLVGNRQMLTVGGSLRNQALYNIETVAQTLNMSSFDCDWETKGVAIFDMTTHEWGSKYNSSADLFQVPDLVLSTIGGRGDGGATMTAPVGGFAAAAISAMFANRSTGSSTSKGVIAGAVVGGIAGLCIVVGTVIYVLRKKKRETQKEAEEMELRQQQTKYTGPPYSELTEESRYELASRSRMPEIMVGNPAHELHTDQRPSELA